MCYLPIAPPAGDQVLSTWPLESPVFPARLELCVLIFRVNIMQYSQPIVILFPLHRTFGNFRNYFDCYSRRRELLASKGVESRILLNDPQSMRPPYEKKGSGPRHWGCWGMNAEGNFEFILLNAFIWPRQNRGPERKTLAQGLIASQ